MLDLRVLVVADDLSGAADTGVHFARSNQPALLITRLEACDPTALSHRTLVVNTESRELRKIEAFIHLARVIDDFRGGLLYKKIDSTLRGHIALELDQLMNISGRAKAIICPAFPKQDRRLVGGRLLIGDTPLIETEFGRDPGSPWTDDLVPLLEAQLNRPVVHLSRLAYASGFEQLMSRIKTVPEAIVVVDAEDQDDIDIVGQAVAGMADKLIACGSAGLAEAIGRQINPFSCRGEKKQPACARVLFVSGTRREATRLQIIEALRKPHVVDLDVRMSPDYSSITLNSDITDLPEHQQGCFILSTAGLEYRPGMETCVRESLAEIALALMQPLKLDGLILSGGATAQAVCDALSLTRLEIHHELSPGLPLCRIQSGLYREMWVATKAGGFGDRQALVGAIEALQGVDLDG